MAKQRPTRRQLEVLRAYIRAGSVAAAAANTYQLGISKTTARQHLSGLYRKTGCLDAAQAAEVLSMRQCDDPMRLGHDARRPVATTSDRFDGRCWALDPIKVSPAGA